MPASRIAETTVRDLTPADLLTEAFWTEFLSGLVVRGLTGVQLAISDAHAALKAAMAKVLGCAWQALHRALPLRLPRPRPQGLISSVMRWLLRPLGPAGPPGPTPRYGT